MLERRHVGLVLMLLVLLVPACSVGDDGEDDTDVGGVATSVTDAANDDDTPQSTPSGDDAAEGTSTNDDDGAEGTSTDDGSEGTSTTQDTTQASPTSQDMAEASPTGQPAGATGGTSGDVYLVGDAGEVEMRRENDRLVLVEVRPSDGWMHREDDNDDDDELEVIFTQDSQEMEFEAEIDNGELRTKICDETLNPAGDVFTVGESGEVEARHEGDELVLVEVRPNGSWTHEIDDEDDDSIEIIFRADDGAMTFDYELDDGAAEAKVCTLDIR